MPNSTKYNRKSLAVTNKKKPGVFITSDFLLYFVEQVVKNSGPPIFGLDLSRLIVPFGELWPVTSSGYMNEIS